MTSGSKTAPYVMNARIFKLTLASVLLAFSGTIWAQDEIDCASGDVYEDLIDNDPVFERSMMYLNRRLLEMHDELAQRDDEILTVPTVVHVIHIGEDLGMGTNISDEQVFSAIDALNEDFRKMEGTNGDGDGVDVGIEFCLASRDPDGNSSNGIVRVDGTSVADYELEGIEATGSVGADELEVKQLSTWPREDYLNIWVVNEIENNDAGSGVQGYAYFPINNPVDGIVILHNAFGTVGNLKPNTDMNRTLTHEVGHYIGLYHTFHNTPDCDPEANCETGGDKVCDTPVTPTNPSCTSPACSGTQQVENYMDYTSETCRNMFSQGQKDRMRGTLISDRASILESFGCVPVTQYDAGISTLIEPSGSLCDNSVQPVVMLTNYGSETLTSVNFSYGVNGSLTNSYSWSGSIAPGGSTEVTLDTFTASMGDHIITIETSNPNGQSDEYDGNDQSLGEFIISSGATLTLEVSLDFFGEETSWEVLNDEGALIAEGGPYMNNSQGTVMEESICAAGGCYTLWMYDDYGDGMSFLNGTYTLYGPDDEILASGGGNYGAAIDHDFCVEEIVVEGEAPIASFNIASNSICVNGEADFSDTSTESPTTYSWEFEGGSPATSSLANPQGISYAQNGTYEVTLTVTNDFGSDTSTQAITVNNNPSVTLIAVDCTCNGSDNGLVSAMVTPSGSVSYDWNTGTTGNSIANLDPGYYTVTVTDENGCEGIAYTTIDEPDAIDVSIETIDISCFGLSDGSAVAEASGGMGSYSHNWDGSESGNTMSGLTSGTHELIVTDGAGCEQITTFEINQPEALVANLTDFDIACEALSGGALVSPEGGNGGYTVNWSTGQNSNEISDLSAGDYSVSIVDALGCTIEESFEITQSEALAIALDIEDVSCFGLNNGSVLATVNGGTGNISYAWSNGGTDTSIQSLAPGEYSITATDETGCEGTAEFTIDEPEVLEVVVFKTDISCFGMADGTATASTSGGNGDFSYDWSNGQHDVTAVGLEQGNHTVSVFDPKGCSANEQFTIIEPSALSLSASVVQGETCAGADGSGLVNVMGGTGDYSFDWSNGQNNQTAEGLTAGDYTITVSDANGCEAQIELSIPYNCEEELPTTSLLSSDCGMTGYMLDDYVTCEAIADAEMYQWKFENAAVGLFAEEFTIAGNNSFQLGMIPGIQYGIALNISVKVLYDGSWSPYGETCTILLSQDIPTTQLVDSDCEAENISLSAMIQTEMITGASEYEWLFTAEEFQETFTSYLNSLTLSTDMGLMEGESYHISVRVKVGESWSEYGATCTITLGIADFIDGFSSSSELTIYPNPNNGEKIFIELGNLSATHSVSALELFSSTGKLIETFRLSDEVSLGRTEHQFENRLPAGMYVVRYTADGNTQEEKLIVR